MRLFCGFCVALSAATAAPAAGAAGSTLSLLTMKSQLGSKIKMGGAVINSYCESDLQPGFVRAYSVSEQTRAGIENDVVLVLENVKTSCSGNGGMAPCATDAGADRFPSFVCQFTGADGNMEESAKVQGIRVEDISPSGQVLGIETQVKCAMPPRENSDHSVSVSLVYRRNDKDIAIPFTGVAGTNVVAISSTASPTAAPTTTPPTPNPTLAPTTPPTTSGCNTERALNSYYRSCSASSEKPSQFFSKFHSGEQLTNCDLFSFFCFFSFNDYTSTELRTFFCGNSRPGTRGSAGSTSFLETGTRFFHAMRFFFNQPNTFRFFFFTSIGNVIGRLRSVETIWVEANDGKNWFETSGDAENESWLKWEFDTPVVVTRIQWRWPEEMSSRSGGVSVTGSSGGTGYIPSGAESVRNVDWGIDCMDCPKGGSIKFKAIDGMPWGHGDWGVDDITLYGCTKSDSKQNGGGLTGWSHDLHNMRNMNCPANYQDEDGDGVCELCKTLRDCGPGNFFNGTLCSTDKDNTCSPCLKPVYSKFAVADGGAGSGTCNYTCTHGMTGPACDISNVCHSTNLVLGDLHGDGWNEAQAHIDAYTGPNQWRHAPSSEATWLKGEGTKVTNPSSAQKALFNLGCIKDGCYAIHFHNIGSFPKEIMVFGSDGMEPSGEENIIVPGGSVESTSQMFWFQVHNGHATAATKEVCDDGTQVPFVQLGDTPTLAPGLDVDYNTGEAADKYHDANDPDHLLTAYPTEAPTVSPTLSVDLTNSLGHSTTGNA